MIKIKRIAGIFLLLIFSLCSWSQSNDKVEIRKLAQTLIGEKTKKDPDSARVWKTGGQATFTFSQTSFTNWATGGDNSVAGNSLANMFVNYNKNKASWDNILELGYGLVSLGDEGLRKSDDKIDIASKFGRVAYKKWNYSSLINFKSQFANGYEYPNDSVIVSKFLAPAYILLAIGLDYKPDDKLTIFISPFTGKTTIVNDQALADSGAFGMEPALMDTLGNRLKAGTNIRYEFGGYLKFFYKNEILKDINFQTKLEFFSNYSEEPQNVDVNWEMLLVMKINKYISTNISTNLIYDHDISITDKEGATGPRTQFKEIIGVGLSYKF